jgi:hypothetical protein
MYLWREAVHGIHDLDLADSVRDLALDVGQLLLDDAKMNQKFGFASSVEIVSAGLAR